MLNKLFTASKEAERLEHISRNLTNYQPSDEGILGGVTGAFKSIGKSFNDISKTVTNKDMGEWQKVKTATKQFVGNTYNGFKNGYKATGGTNTGNKAINKAAASNTQNNNNQQ